MHIYIYISRKRFARGLEGNEQPRTECRPARRGRRSASSAPARRVVQWEREARSRRPIGASGRAGAGQSRAGRVPRVEFPALHPSPSSRRRVAFKSAARAARQSPRAAATVRVARPPIVRDAPREDRRDNVSRRGNSVGASTPDPRVPWGVEARGGRPRPQSRPGVAPSYARELPEDVRQVQV